MRWSAAAVATATGGVLEPESAADVVLDGASIDSRQIEPGQLFVAIRAERDGHQFVPAAAAHGAGAVLVDHVDGPLTAPAITVADTGSALLALGAAARDRLPGPVVGITGSVGKTTTKDLAAAAVATRRRTVASQKSFNNELGVPLTLINAPEDSEVALVEMGARGPGHIALLCRTARPAIGVVTAVAAAHTETFGGLEAVAEAKGELIESLPPDGAAILNADYDLVRAMAGRSVAPVLLYSAAGAEGAEIVAEGIQVDEELRPRFVVRSPWGATEVRLEARGAHNVGNALAALTVAVQCGVDLDQAAGALEHARLSPWRMEVEQLPSGAVVLNDAYNANPTSMEAALRALAALPAQRRTAVLGPMAELGDRAPTDHAAAADLARTLGIRVLAVGTDLYGVEPTTVDQAVRALGLLGEGDAVLVKGSRVAGLEHLADRLIRG